METLPVVFRIFEGECLALFPTLEWGGGLCASYAHVGQHAGADYAHVIRVSRPATPCERAQLLDEIRQIYGGPGGVRLRVVARAPALRARP